jgi:hypothetical protein
MITRVDKYTVKTNRAVAEEKRRTTAGGEVNAEFTAANDNSIEVHRRLRPFRACELQEAEATAAAVPVLLNADLSDLTALAKGFVQFFLCDAPRHVADKHDVLFICMRDKPLGGRGPQSMPGPAATCECRSIAREQSTSFTQ